jgi:hypothetical protein
MHKGPEGQVHLEPSIVLKLNWPHLADIPYAHLLGDGLLIAAKT